MSHLPSSSIGSGLPGCWSDTSRYVDAHVHVRGRDGFAAVRAAGVVALRDAGSRENAADADLAAGSLPDNLILVRAGWALYKKGGYGSRFGIPLDSREEIIAEILKLKTAGAAIIKVMASGMVSLKEPGSVTAGGFNAQELRLIVGTAYDAGLDVMAHANGEQHIIDAVQAGVRSIEHGFFISERALEVMARQRVFWVPTVGALARAAEAYGAAARVHHFVKSSIRTHQSMIARAHALGVPLAIGTDCVLPDRDYGKAYQAELAYFEQTGFSCETVNTIACENGARLLGI